MATGRDSVQGTPACEVALTLLSKDAEVKTFPVAFASKRRPPCGIQFLEYNTPRPSKALVSTASTSKAAQAPSDRPRLALDAPSIIPLEAGLRERMRTYAQQRLQPMQR